MDGEYKKPLIKKFEKLLINGVSEENWLKFPAEVAKASPSDVKNNFVDLFVIVNINPPLLDSETSLSVDNLTFSLNFTLEQSREEIKSLLLKTPDSSLPNGLTYLGENSVEIPRLVLGLSDYDLDRVSENPNSPFAKKIRFKLLSEIVAELDLYLTIFPDSTLPTSLEGDPSPALKNYASLSAASSFFRDLLFDSIESLLDLDLLPPPPRSVSKVPRKLLAYAEAYFKKESRDNFHAETLEKKSRPFYERVGVTDNDTFVQILSLANECKLTSS